MLSLYYLNSLTFIANLTGTDSVSHKIIGQKHSEKTTAKNQPHLQENDPLVISSHVDPVFEASCWQQYFLFPQLGDMGILGTSRSHSGS